MKGRLAAALAAGLIAALLLPAFASTVSAATGRSHNKANPFGVTVVRFAKGTTTTQMRSAITAAGGSIVSDLTKIGAIAAVPSRADFATRIKANARVKAVWVDRISVTIPRTDTATGGKLPSANPQIGHPGTQSPPDPFHNATSFLGETNPEGILQWDDNRMNVPAAWRTTLGDRTVKVAVLDTGVQGSHKEILPNYLNQDSTVTIPCNLLTRQFGPLGNKDCSSEDTEGHGTWVASRIAGAVNGFGSNGVAPRGSVMGVKVLSTTLGGGLTSWIVDGMIHACDAGADLINMSLGGYDDPVADANDYLLWVAGVNYCRAKGTAIFASAGNEHVRVNRVNLTVGGTAFTGVGQVATGDEGILQNIPGEAKVNLGGLLETPAGVPGVVMVSATGNAIGGSASDLGGSSLVWPDSFKGRRDQLTYYSSYGSRVDIAAPGGARKFNIPRYDVGAKDILYGGWGSLGALDASGEICTDPSLASILTFTCFKVNGQGFGWLQGTSMSSPNATGVAALTLAAHHELQGHPDSLLARLKSTARTNMTNFMVRDDPDNHAADVNGNGCTTGYCHLDFDATPISFASAYGAGIVNASAAVAP